METEGSRRQRPVTAGNLSRQRAKSSNGDDRDDHAFEDGSAQQHRSTPARPSTQRSTRSTPRASIEAVRRMSRHGPDGDAPEKIRSELEALRIKLRETDLAKSHAQVQLQRQGADMAKLERYIGQLVDDRGGVDDSVMENIVRDAERSSRVKNALKKVSELKSELSHKDKQISTLRKSQAAEYTLKLAAEKEALAARIERLVAESNEHHRGTTMKDSGQRRRASSSEGHSSKNNLVELERLRAQNLEMRKETARLRTTLDLAEMGDKRGGGGGGHGDGDFGKKKNGAGGARYFEGQLVECRKKGSDSWSPATIESARLTVEPLGRSRGGDSKTYMYSVYFDDKEGTYEDCIPESRLRSKSHGEGDEGPGHGSSRVVKNSEGETFIRSRVFGPGDLVLVRQSESGGSNRGGGKKWNFGEVIRRNDGGTYRVVVLGGPPEGSDVHPTMLRAQDIPADDDKEEFGAGGGVTPDGMEPLITKTTTTSPGEEAEMQYAEKRDKLLRLARGCLPPPLQVGQEVLAKNGGSTVWGAGVVVSTDDNNLRCSVEFDFGDVEENIPCIFVRPRRGEDLASHRRARSGDAVLAQKGRKDDTGGGDGRDWFNARFEHYHDDDRDVCYVVFAGESSLSRVRAARVRPLYCATLAGGQRPHPDDGDTIPGNPPPPTKPVRAKKHHEGDVILACIPTVKKWTPALITGVKGRGRYSVEWADGMQADSLLFMFIASIEGNVRKRAIAGGGGSIAGGGGSIAGGNVTGGSVVDGGDSKRNEGNTTTTTGGDRPPHGRKMSASGAAAATRLRQRALTVGEPVLAKRAADNGFWSPGTVTKADGGGKYDVQFTDGTTIEDLSFLFVRALGSQEDGRGGGEGGEVGARGDRIDSGGSDSKPRSERGTSVGDTVYVLKRGISPETTSQDTHNRDLWRVGTVTVAANGRFTVQYNGEEGKPKESRIVPGRIRARNVIRQRAVQKGDAVLALSDVPGRGWVMGAVTARGGDGKYTISFADGTQSDKIRFVNLRRVVGRAIDDKEEDNRQEDKPVRRAIRQRRFKKGELALAKHPESRKWVVVKVLEALPSGRYDLEFLGDEGTPDAVGVPFQSIRHLDLAQFTLGSHVAGSSEGDRDSRQVTMERASRENTAEKRPHRHRSPSREGTTETRGRQTSDESWDEHDHGGGHPGGGGGGGRGRGGGGDSGSGEEFGPDRDERGRRRQGRQRAPSGGDYDRQGSSSRTRRTEDRDHDTSQTAQALDVGSDVLVLRRGKSSDAPLEDKNSWRVGTVISVRSNGTFGVEYDEAGAPKEDRITESRLRRRRVAAAAGGDRPTGNTSVSSHSRSDNEHQHEIFEEGDTVSASVGGRRGEEWKQAKVQAVLGDDAYRVAFTDGSGTRELESGKLRYARDNHSSPRHAGLIETTKKAVKKRKLADGQIVLARKKSSGDPNGRKWQPAKVVKSDGDGHYSVLFAGDPDATRVHFTDVKPLENFKTEGGDGTAGARNNTKATTDNNDRSNHNNSNNNNNNNNNKSGASGFLRVTAPSFDLKITASAARRTSPRLILATGEREDAESNPPPWLRHQAGGNGNGNNSNGSDQDKGVGFVTRSTPRPGTRSPAWKDGEFWLSLEGLEDPSLFLALEDAKKESRGGGGGVSEDAILAEACILLPMEEVRRRSDGGRRGSRCSSGTFEVELNDGAGVVSLQWSTHKDTSSMKTEA